MHTNDEILKTFQPVKESIDAFLEKKGLLQQAEHELAQRNLERVARKNAGFGKNRGGL